MDHTPSIFADGLVEATVRHGVARLSFGLHGADNQPKPAVVLAIPLVQLPNLAGALTKLIQEVQSKAREAQAAATPAAAPSGIRFEA